MAIKDRGFGSLNPIDRRRISSMGGKAAHAKGTAHRFTPDEARIAGAKGGKVKRQDRVRPVSIPQGWPAFGAEALLAEPMPTNAELLAAYPDAVSVSQAKRYHFSGRPVVAPEDVL